MNKEVMISLTSSLHREIHTFGYSNRTLHTHHQQAEIETISASKMKREAKTSHHYRRHCFNFVRVVVPSEVAWWMFKSNTSSIN
eukprot:m.214075 g.214075  ORF g.214075 m.214075 type:complete len:84 (+) comp13797_c0_seq1:1201-1452(+)